MTSLPVEIGDGCERVSAVIEICNQIFGKNRALILSQCFARTWREKIRKAEKLNIFLNI